MKRSPCNVYFHVRTSKWCRRRITVEWLFNFISPSYSETRGLIKDFLAPRIG